ncbi:MAG: trypsin-like peptidase domain-containing protein [Candidatus Omnitrophica bacterium]|nr:trypsin-like peptidase domain-containing protein [Candidatus Omnitrophota bacterium]
MHKGSSPTIIWIWVGGVVLFLGVIAMISNNGRSASRQQNAVPGGVTVVAANQNPAPVQAGVPQGMNTGALESTYNQIADVMNRITVSIYSNDPTKPQPLLLGSGVVISKQMILTNAHVVNNLDNLFVSFGGAQAVQYPVGLFRCDGVNDLAVLQVMNNVDFPVVGMLGNSDMVDRGDIVFTTGNAFGTGNVMANGMIIDNVSAQIVNGQTFNNKFRTNINIYPGSCGGPLVNIRGEVIGVNNSAGLPDNSYMGIGYATPVNFAVALLNSTAQNQGGATNPFIPVAYSGNPYVLT